jgi:hypothetical protein
MFDSMTMTRLFFEYVMIHMFVRALSRNSFPRELPVLAGAMQALISFGSRQQIAILFFWTTSVSKRWFFFF